jgi:NitT/TauT family transport system ATP-binding protein
MTRDISTHRRPAVVIEGVSHTFRAPDGRVMSALDSISLDLYEREFFAIVGPSGCGKSTLLNMVSGLLKQAEGSIELRGDGRSLTQRDVGYITQDSNLYPWCTVIENILVPLQIRKVAKAEARERAQHWIKLVGLSGFENHYPKQLSGGMQKRCSIARTMVYNPDLLLMDEPFGALDAITRQTLQGTILELWQQRQTSVMFITHDLTEAISLSDRVAVMSSRPGQIRAVIDIDLERPRDVQNVTSAPRFRSLREELWHLLEPELGAHQAMSAHD